jgi:hypothetical protein
VSEKVVVLRRSSGDAWLKYRLKTALSEPCFALTVAGTRTKRAVIENAQYIGLTLRAGKSFARTLRRMIQRSKFFCRQIDEAPRPVVIAADVPVGLPAEPADVFEFLRVNTFLDWLSASQERLQSDGRHWRDGLIAKGVSGRTSLTPFVSICKGDGIGDFAGLRKCDRLSGGESVYCMDHGGKQVGKAALQFWFDVLMPLREKFKEALSVWPFESRASKEVVIAECYPAKCQRMVYPQRISKRQAVGADGMFGRAQALSWLYNDANPCGISTNTWIHAASSEDEFDMFTTAFAIRSLMQDGAEIFWHPGDLDCILREGWMLGLGREEPLPRESKRPKSQPGLCWCGCGGSTKSRFVPGHDARFHGRAKRVASGKESWPESFVHAEAEADLRKWHDAAKAKVAADAAKRTRTAAGNEETKGATAAQESDAAITDGGNS